MDWTGGVRNRFAKHSRFNTNLQKQRAHFASQRAKALHSHAITLPNRYQEQTKSAKDLSWLIPHKRKDRNCKEEKCACAVLNKSSGLHSNLYSPTHRTIRASRLKLKMVPSVERDLYPRSLQGGSDVDDSRTRAEKLFLQRRSQFLDRPDWLKLSVLKPLQVGFPADNNDECVGRRRKITRSSIHRRQTIQHSNTALTRERRSMPEHGQSNGALRKDEIKVKIGTQAFTSQVLDKFPSQMEEIMSMCPMSASIDSLSEQSMLLGDNEDALESRMMQPGTTCGLFREHELDEDKCCRRFIDAPSEDTTKQSCTGSEFEETQIREVSISSRRTRFDSQQQEYVNQRLARSNEHIFEGVRHRPSVESNVSTYLYTSITPTSSSNSAFRASMQVSLPGSTNEAESLNNAEVTELASAASTPYVPQSVASFKEQHSKVSTQDLPSKWCSERTSLNAHQACSGSREHCSFGSMDVRRSSLRSQPKPQHTQHTPSVVAIARELPEPLTEDDSLWREFMIGSVVANKGSSQPGVPFRREVH